MKFIVKHKGLFIILGLLLILIIIMVMIFGRMFIKSNSDTYGNRLKGIVKINEKDNKKIIDDVKELDEVEDVSIRIQGKIIYIELKYKHGTSVAKAKEIANKIPSMYSEDVLEDYDLGLFLVESPDDDKDTSEFVIAGTKHPLEEGISYTKS